MVSVGRGPLTFLSHTQEEGIYSTPQYDDDALSLASQVRRARSVDGSCQDLSTLVDEIPARPVTRARSEFNLDQHRFTRKNKTAHNISQYVSLSIPLMHCFPQDLPVRGLQ